MNKNELKRIIKPLVKECINEVLLEEGLLSNVDLFEGTQPTQDSQPTAGTADLGSASDSGVDISALVGNASKIWDAMK